MINPEGDHPFNAIEQRVEPAPNFAVLTPFEFLADFRMEARKAKHRVWGQALDMQTGHPGGAFFHIFEEATKRGLDARLNIDWFSRLVSEPGINSTITIKSAIGKGKYHRFFKDHNQKTYRRLARAGVKVSFLNPPDVLQRVFPFFGRNHIKIYIIDNIAYLGGINIDDSSFKSVDFVVKISDPEIVETLTEQFVSENQEKEDQQIDLENGTVFVDGGKAGQSIILDAAIYMIDIAKKGVRNISSFTPDGPFLNALRKAHERGVNVEVLKPTGTRGVYALLDFKNKLFMTVNRKRVPFTLTEEPVHAKLLIVDDEAVLFGSHNLMQSGVNAGTREIALFSTNPQLVQNLVSFYTKIRSQAVKR